MHQIVNYESVVVVPTASVTGPSWLTMHVNAAYRVALARFLIANVSRDIFASRRIKMQIVG